MCCTFCGLSTLLISYYIITIIVLGDGIPPQAGDIPDFYWGPHDPHRKKADDEKWEQISITVGNISVSELHTKLREELSSGRVVASLENSGFKYGFQSKFLPTVVDHWTSKYNWAKRQEWLNSVPHFRMKISGLSIHFRYMRAPKVAKGKEVIPILLIHGWPGSFVEFQNVMPSLANPREGDVYFEVNNWHFLAYLWLFKCFQVRVQCGCRWSHLPFQDLPFPKQLRRKGWGQWRLPKYF